MPTALQDDQDQEAQKEINESGFDIRRSKEQQAEIDRLNADYEEPAVTSEERESNANKNSENKQPSESKDLFNNSESNQSTNKVTNVFNRTTGWIKGNPIKAGGSGLGIVGVFVGVFFVMTLSGPLQFIHLTQFMDAIHFSDSETTNNNRVRKLVQYVHTRDMKQTRLGVIGNRIANNVDKEMLKTGWSSTYDSAGNWDGYKLEPTRSEKKPSLNQAKKEVAAKAKEYNALGYQTSVERGVLTVKPGSGIIDSRADHQLISDMHENNTEHGKIVSAVQRHLMKKRGRVFWNPISRLDNKIKGTVADKIKDWKEKRIAERGTTKANGVTVSAKDQANDKSTNAEKSAAKANADTVSSIDDLKTQASTGKLTAAKIGGGGAAVIGALCVAKQIADGADESRMLATKLPLMRISAEYMAYGAKMMAGDVDMEVADELSKELSNADSGSWSQANSIQYYQGNEGGGTKLPEELNPNPAQSDFAKILDQPIINGACTVLNSAVGVVVGIAVGVVTGPVSFLASAAIMPIVINGLETFLSTDPIDMSKYSGAVLGEAISTGSALLSNENNAVMGGMPMTDQQVAELDQQTQLVKKDVDSSRSIADKYLNPYKYDTATAKVIDNTSSTNIASSLIKFPKYLVSSLPKILSGKALAAEPPKYSELNYGMHKVAFPVELLNSVENPYKNANEVQNILKKNPSLADKLKTCNNISVDPETLTFSFDADSTIPSFERLLTTHPECGKIDDTNFNKLRIAALDTASMQSYACYQYDDSESCADIDGQNSTDSTTNIDTSQSSPTSYGPFTFPVQTTKAEIKAKGWCWDQVSPTCHGTESYGYFASDIFNNEGNVIVSATNGTVIDVKGDADNKSGSAKETLITIKADDCDDSGTKLTCLGKGTVFWYGHMQPGSAKVKAGDRVTSGQPIAISGGPAQGDGTAHLHFDASDRRNPYRQACARETPDLCKSVGFIDIQPQLHEAFGNLP